MRLSRTSLLARLTGPDAPAFVALEAPTGFGKSWLLRKAAPPGAIRLRGELGPFEEVLSGSGTAIVIDDAHALTRDDVERLVELVEDADHLHKVIVSGRLLADEILDVANLVDGLVLDVAGLAITREEILAEFAGLSQSSATKLIEVTGGCVKVVAAALKHGQLEPDADPVMVATRILRSATAASLQMLDPADAGLVGLLSKLPELDRALLARLGGPDFIERIIGAGIMLRRQPAGFDILGGGPAPAVPVSPEAANELATALSERGRHVEAIGMLIDGGAHVQAAETLAELPESITRSVEPRAMLALLARLGALVERHPALLVLRAAASLHIGRGDLAAADIDRALGLVDDVEPRVRRRVSVEAAEWMLVQGKYDEAVAAVHAAIRDLGPGEDRTYARAHSVLADAAALSFRRNDLQRAAEWYRVAAVAWEGCGEPARARSTRCDLATQVLEPLGRFDEALAQLASILAASDLTDAERTWFLLCEGLVLLSSNRLDSAESRLQRVADLGYLQDNPRMIAAAAWGHGLVAARRDDVSVAMRWFSTAENTALGTDDDIAGVPFHCDVAIVAGALGELETAERHLAAASHRSAGQPDRVRLAKYILEARRGIRGDLDAQLEKTPPVEWWRVLLVTALAAAREGSYAEAQRLLLRAERELITLGFSDFKSLGERRAYEELRAILRNAPEVPLESAAPAAAGASRRVARPVERRETAEARVRVIGSAMLLERHGETIELPAGNPQRLVGVVIAHGGSASFDQISEAMWPGDDVEPSRVRLRNVLLRLRRAAGDIVVRSGTGLRLAPDVGCDLFDFEQQANDALSSVRADPDLAGHIAEQAVALVDGAVFGDFEYEEWALGVRRSVDQRLIGLLDLLSVRAEDVGDLPLAQSLAERALRLDRYTDSRYVRLAELLTLQGRAAAAVAVLEDAAAVAREVGSSLPTAVRSRRDDLMRRASNG